MRNIAAVACVFGLAVIASASSAATRIKLPVEGEVNTDRVNVRAGRSLNYEIMTRLDKGARVVVTGKSGGWFRIVPPRGVPFWVSSRYISKGRVLSGRLNVRARPSVRATVVCQLRRGDRVKKKEERGEWASIEAPPHASCWVSSELIDLVVPRGARASSGGRAEAEGAREAGEIQGAVVVAGKASGAEEAAGGEVASRPQGEGGAKEARWGGPPAELPKATAAATALPSGAATEQGPVKEVEAPGRGAKKAAEKEAAARSGGEEKAGKEKAGAPEIEPRKEPRPCLYEGRLIRAEGLSIVGTRHRLIKGFFRKRVACMLKSETVNLDFYVNDRVKVWGYETKRLPSGVPIVDVRRLEVK